MPPLNLPTPSGRRCTACPAVFPPYPRVFPPPPGTIATFPVHLCHRCGHLMTDGAGGTLRDLTRAEKLMLPRHRQAARIRAEQEKVTRGMIG